MFEPTTVYGTLFWGVVAGVLTSSFLLVCGLVASKIAIPWYLRIVYRGIDLSGQWAGVREDKEQGARYTYTTALHQSAHELTGTMTKTKTGTQADDYVHTFLVTGNTRDGFVVLNLQSSNLASSSLGTALLKIYKTGGQLKGFLLYRGRNDDTVELDEIEWVRPS